MDKKGASSHVDWAISVGIFVIYILLLFIFLRPGTEPSYSQDKLLGIVESNLAADGKYSIEMTPLFIRPVVSNFPDANPSKGQYQVQISNTDLPFNNKDDKTFSLQLVNHTELGFEMKLKNPPRGDSIRFNSTFEGKDKNYTFVLVYSDEYFYSRSLVKLQEGEKDEMLFINDLSDKANFTYDLGVKEVIKGFSPDKLQAITNDYTSLKSSWKFPSDMDFSVIVTDLENGETLKSVNNVVAPLNINVFANTYLDWLLAPNATVTPVNVTIKVW